MPIPPGTLSVANSILGYCVRMYTAWKDKAAKVEREELERLIAEIQSGKSLGHRVGENLSRSLQSLRLSTETVDALRVLDSDPLFHHNAAERLAKGALSPQEFAELLRRSMAGTGNNVPKHEIESVAAIWLDAIHMAVGESSALAHVLQIKSAHRTEGALSSVAEKTDIIVSGVEEIRRSQDTGMAISLESLSLLRSLVDRDNNQPSPQAVAAQSILQKQFETRFEKCRNHLIGGSVEVAEQEFAALIKELDDAGELGSKDLLFRSHLNHSSCLLLLQRNEAAKAALEHARQMSPDDNRFHRHHATLLSHEGKNVEALTIIQRLRQIEPDAPKNIADEIALLMDLHRDDELESLIDAIDIEDADVLCHKSHALSRLKRDEEAVTTAKRATGLKPDAEGPWIALAYSLGFPVVARWEGGYRCQFCPSEEDAAQLSGAIEAALKAEEILQKRCRMQLHEEVQANLLAFYTLACRHEEGLGLAMRMRISSATSEVALNNLYHIFALSEKDTKALEVANALAEKLKTDESKIRRATALVVMGQGQQALQELEDLKLKSPEIANNPMWIAISSSAHYCLHHGDAAINQLKIGIDANPDSPVLHLAMAKLLAEMRQKEEALKYFHLAENLSPEHPDVLSYFAQFLYFQSDWDGALERFEKLGAKSPLNPLFFRCVVALYNSGKVDACLDCVRCWKKQRSEIDETVFGIGARAAMSLDDWPLAKELLEQLVRIGGRRETTHRKLLAQVYLRLDDLSEAYTLLTQVVAEHDTDVEALTLLGQICCACGKYHEALDQHVKAVGIDTANLQARSAFFSTMLALPKGIEPAPDQINLHHANIALLAAHPSGVLRAIRMTRDDGEFDVTGIQKELEKKEKAVTEVLEYSNQHPMPLQILASDLGSNLFDAWHSFTRDHQRGVRMCGGAKEEQESQLTATKQCQTISVDPIALFTLQRLGHLELLTKLFAKICVHISILDAVVSELRLTRDWPSSGSIASMGGRLIMTEERPDEKESKIKALAEIRTFLKQGNVTLAGLRSDTKFTNVVQGLGDSPRLEGLMKPALVAYEHQGGLLSDDFVFRALSSPLKCPLFCTQALLRRALDEKVISQAEYQDAIIALHSWNYHFVSDNVGTLVRLAEREPSATGAIVGNVVRDLIRSSTSSQPSRTVLIDFLMWLYGKSKTQKDFARQWMSYVWHAIEESDTKMVLALTLVSDIATRTREWPSDFGWVVGFICECRIGTRAGRDKILSHAIAAAQKIATAPLSKLDARTRKKWDRQMKALQILQMMG